MRSAAVVSAEPGRHGGGALCGAGERFGIGPLAQTGLDKALGLAVGARRIGPGPLVLQPGVGDRLGELVAAIGRSPSRPTDRARFADRIDRLLAIDCR